ncbi:hypothetical protein MANAM107_16150 [Actinomyces capricornis]|uniref:Uncharacterized protein n=1 Tax=Actinomyces capricornis TaxID=2755559 RepID=A0ABN6K8X7_9ACTO|nr:hypothetical protein MANAM107_16150 [Actinomyces capricornis]
MGATLPARGGPRHTGTTAIRRPPRPYPVAHPAVRPTVRPGPASRYRLPRQAPCPTRPDSGALQG